jgi:arginyl-tRNA synthetase
VCSIFRKLEAENTQWSVGEGIAALGKLELESEKNLMVNLGRYPEVVSNAAKLHEPHLVANYLRDLAGDFHTWYNSEKTLVEDVALRNARLALAQAVRQVIYNGLDLLGVSAPTEM